MSTYIITYKAMKGMVIVERTNLYKASSVQESLVMCQKDAKKDFGSDNITFWLVDARKVE